MAAWWRFCLLVAAALSPPGPASPLAAPGVQDWRRAAVVYHVDVRLFRDSDGDGVGDLAGVKEGLDFLSKLGVDAVWLSPVFPSASEQYVGYRVSNFTDVDPVFGDLVSFGDLLEAAASLGIKVLLELVPNHTSDLHEWFERSVERQDPYTDYYVWKDAVDVENDQAPPNNWVSVAGGSAWTWNADRGQYFLHQFGDMQPDLNYWNADVKRRMEEVLLFWLRRGVSGFVLGGVSHLYESKDLRDEPLHPVGHDWEYSHLVHSKTLDLPETYHQVQQWRELTAEFQSGDDSTRLLIVETHSSLQSTLAYYGTKDNPIADIPLNFRFLSCLRVNNSAKEMEAAIKDWLLNMPLGSTANWVVGSSVLNDLVTHFSAHVVDALNIMLQVLPGVAVVYNGDSTPETTWEESTDYGSRVARDETYPVLSWELQQVFDSSNKDMSDNETSLPTPASGRAVEASINQEFVDVYARLLKKMALRRSMPALQRGDIHVSSMSADVLLLVRTLEGWDTFAAVVNFGDNLAELNTSALHHNATSITVHASSSNSGFNEGDKIFSPNIMLLPHASMLLRLSHNPPDSMWTSTEDVAFHTELGLLERDVYSGPTTELAFNVTEIQSEDDAEELELVSTAAADNATEIFPEASDNSTEVPEPAEESPEMFTDAAGVENNTEITTAAAGNTSGLYAAAADYGKIQSPAHPGTSEAPARQPTEPSATKSTANEAAERHTRHSLTILLLILLPADFLL